MTSATAVMYRVLLSFVKIIIKIIAIETALYAPIEPADRREAITKQKPEVLAQKPFFNSKVPAHKGVRQAI